MPAFGDDSKKKLAECDLVIRRLMNEVIKHFDCKILVGYRGALEQNEAFAQGKSKLQFPQSKHNVFPSAAVDVAPYPIDFSDLRRFYYFAGVVKGTAASMGIQLRWGGDWDSDNEVKDNSFNDLVHFELLPFKVVK